MAQKIQYAQGVEAPVDPFERIGLQANRYYKSVWALLSNKGRAGKSWYRVIKTTKAYVIVEDPDSVPSATRRISPRNIRYVKATVNGETIHFS